MFHQFRFLVGISIFASALVPLKMKNHPKLTLLHLFTLKMCNATMDRKYLKNEAKVYPVVYVQELAESKQGKVHNIFIKVSYLASLSVNIFVYRTDMDWVLLLYAVFFFISLLLATQRNCFHFGTESYWWKYYTGIYCSEYFDKKLCFF